MIKNKDNIKIVFCFLKDYYLLTIALVLIVIMVSLINSVTPYVFGKIIDTIVKYDFNKTKLLLVFNLIILTLITCLNILQNYLKNILILNSINKIKIKIINKILRMRKKNQDKYLAGELINRIENDISSIITFGIDLCTSFISTIFNIIISIIMIFKFSLNLSLIAIGYIPIMCFLVIIFNKAFRKVYQEQKNYDDNYYGFINEIVHNLDGIKAYLLENKIISKVSGYFTKSVGILKKRLKIENISNIIQNGMSNIFDYILLYTAVILISRGNLTIGTLVSFNEYLNRLFASISMVLSFNMKYNSVLISLNRLKIILDAEVESDDIVNDSTKLEKNKKINKVEIKSLYFTYGNEYILKNVSLKIDEPGLYSIVGKNGSGKTTLINVIMKFYQYELGSIKINNIELEKWSVNDLRKRITYLPKNNFLLNDTLYNNFKIFNDKVSLEQVNNVCKLVGLDTVIKNYKKEYNTKIGENGNILSSGQKQRLSVARMMTRETSILILDEITSDIDGNMEKQILELIQELSKSRIVISISHKLEFVKQSKRIMVLEEGRIANTGTHNELIKKDQYYNSLFKQI